MTIEKRLENNAKHRKRKKEKKENDPGYSANQRNRTKIKRKKRGYVQDRNLDINGKKGKK